MNRVICPLAFLLLSAAGCAATSTHRFHQQLRYDGLYRSPARDEDSTPYWHYLRFYVDGSVIAVSSTGQLEDLKRWFAKGKPDISMGEFSIEGDRLSFSTVSSRGSVDYTGEIVGDRLHLHSYSHINQHRAEDVYIFVKWETEPIAPEEVPQRASTFQRE
jgi:hypothetical protein